MKQGIVIFPFGMPFNIKSNRLLAKLGEKIAIEENATIYTVADIIVSATVKVEYTEQADSTWQLSRSAIEWARREKIDILWIVAAQPHLWRCVRDVAAAIRNIPEQISVCVCREVAAVPENEWFCADSLQARTRTRNNWERRERIFRIMPFFIYRLFSG